MANAKRTMLKKTKEISIPIAFENNVLEGAFCLNSKDYDMGSKFPRFFDGNSLQIALKVTVNN